MGGCADLDKGFVAKKNEGQRKADRKRIKRGYYSIFDCP